jgi:hypothetical protein
MEITIEIPIPVSVPRSRIERGINKLLLTGIKSAKIKETNEKILVVTLNNIPKENTKESKEAIATLGFTLGMLFTVEICKPF